MFAATLGLFQRMSFLLRGIYYCQVVQQRPVWYHTRLGRHRKGMVPASSLLLGWTSCRRACSLGTWASQAALTGGMGGQGGQGGLDSVPNEAGASPHPSNEDGVTRARWYGMSSLHAHGDAIDMF